MANSFTITSVGDTAGDTTTGTIDISGNGSGTLRQAINFANQTAASNPQNVTTVNVQTGLTGTITLAANLPLVATSITLNGGGLTLDGSNQFRGFLIAGIASDGINATATTVNISSFNFLNTLTQGGAGASGGGGGLGAGGAVFVGPQATVTLTDVGIDGATAIGGRGGAIASQGGGGGGGGGLGGNGGSSSGIALGGGGGGLFFGGGGSSGLLFPGSSYAGGGGGGGITSAGGSVSNTSQANAGGAGGLGLAGLGGGGGGANVNGGGGSAGGTGAGAGSGNNSRRGGFGGGGGGGNSGEGVGGFGGGGAGFGAGGFGGGGGGGSGSRGGFGGGGGAGATAAAFGGFGAGDGAAGSSGGGGASLGGAIFVAAGGSLTIAGTTSETGGSVISSGGTNFGLNYGSGIFFEGNPSGTPAATLSFGAGDQSIADQIFDFNGSPPSTTSNGLGGTGGVTALAKTGTGTLTLSSGNLYTGGTTISAGVVAVGDAYALGSGFVTLSGGTLRGNIASASTISNGYRFTTSSGAITNAQTGTANTLTLTGQLSSSNSAPFRFGSATDTGVIVLAPSTYQIVGSINAYALSVDGGTLRAGNNLVPTLTSQLGSTSVTGSAILDFASYAGTIANLQGTSAAAKVQQDGGTLEVDSGSYVGAIRDGSSAVALNKATTGTLTLSGTSTYSGATTISGGVLLVDGSIASSSTTVQNNATLGGVGTTGAVSVVSGGTLSPGDSPGIMSTGSLSFASGAIYLEQIGGASLGTQYDQTGVTGTVNLGGATLNVQTLNNFVPSAGQVYTIINNDRADPVQGTFAGLSEGATVSVGGVNLTISYHGGDGNDVTLSAPVSSSSSGGGSGGGASSGGGSSGGGSGSSGSTMPSSGPDLLTGTPGDDTIAGLGGDDTISGGDGNDLLYGNQGNDSIDAGAGNNSVYGGVGDDIISAGAGNDLIFGNEGADTINAGDGNNIVVGGQDSSDGADLITTGAGNDLIYGNGGDDSVAAGAGNDIVVGGFGNDILFGNQGNDLIYGNQGNDIIDGGTGDDTLIGGQGDDTLICGDGNDVIYGNEGADRIVFGANSGNDIVMDFLQSDGDRLDLQGQTYTTLQDTNGNAVLALSGGGLVTLAGIAANQVNAGMFA